MKIGELFVELGFNVKGADKLKAFETSMVNAANAATKLVVAMRMLAGLKVPDAYKNLKAIKVSPSTPAPGGEPTDEGASKIAKSLSNLTKLLGLAGLGGILIALTRKLKDMVVGVAKSQFELYQFTRQTGMTRDQMKRWERLGAKGGMTADELQKQMLSIQSHAVKVSQGAEAPVAPSLGLTGEFDVERPERLVLQLAEAVRGMAPAVATSFANAYGVDPRLIQAVQDFGSVLEEAIPADLTKEEAKNLERLNQAFTDLTFQIQQGLIKAVAILSPALIDLANWATKTFQSGGIFKDLAEAFYGATGRGDQAQFERNMAAIADARSRTLQARGAGGDVTNNVTVYGTGEPKETAKEVKRALSDSYYQRYSPYGPAGGFYAP